MKKLTASVVAVALATSTLIAAPAMAQTGNTPTVCMVNDREATYKKAYYPEIGQTVESVATGATVYNKFEDGVYSDYIRASEVYFYTPTVMSKFIYGELTDTYQNIAADYYVTAKAKTDGAIRECLGNVTTEYSRFYTPVDIKVSRPADVPGADGITPPTTTQKPAPTTTPQPAPTTTQKPAPSEPVDAGSSDEGSSAAVGVAAIIATIAAILAAFSFAPDGIPFL